MTPGELFWKLSSTTAFEPARTSAATTCDPM